MRERTKSARPKKAELDALVREATLDAYDEEEQLMGIFTMIQDNLQVPFETIVLGVTAVVERVDLVGRDRSHIVAVCRRGRLRQAIPITALPLPSRRPRGAKWIDAYRHWCGE